MSSEKPTFGIVVDGSCLGNPGYTQYQGFDLSTGKKLFYNKFDLGTNNIAEFLAIVHGLMYLKKNMDFKGNIVYSDSITAMTWVTKKQSNSYALDKKDPRSEKALNLIRRSEMWLVEQKRLSLYTFWDKKLWGESIADFGYKNKTVAIIVPNVNQTEVKLTLSNTQLQNPVQDTQIQNPAQETPDASEKFQERKNWFNER